MDEGDELADSKLHDTMRTGSEAELEPLDEAMAEFLSLARADLGLGV